MAVDRIRTGSQAMHNSLSFYPGVPSVSRSPPFARPHRAATPKIAVSPALTHTLVGPTLLVRFARPSILEQDASKLIVSSHDPLTTGTNLSDANGSGQIRTDFWKVRAAKHPYTVPSANVAAAKAFPTRRRTAADSPTAAPRPARSLCRPCGTLNQPGKNPDSSS